MNPGIFLIQDNDELVEMNEQAYDSEELLQTLLAKYPSLLVGNQIDAQAPRKWLLIDREFGVPSEEGGGDQWSLDHLFLDQDAIPTIVEVKRSTDTRIRREVVGQMLDYAANAVVYWPLDRIRSRFEANCERNGVDSEETLRNFLDGDAELGEFWQRVDTNLRAGRVRLLFVADEIPTRLQRIIEFLNGQMNPAQVLAVEIKQFVGQGLRSLVPRVIGQTAEAKEKNSTGSQPSINESEFFQVLEENTSPQDAEVAKQILDWSNQKASNVKWRNVSFAPRFDCNSSYPHMPVSVSVDGKVGINFVRMKRSHQLPDEVRLEILRRLNTIPGIDLPQDSIERKPTIPLAALADDSVLGQFLDIMGWTLELVEAAHRDTAANMQSLSAPTQ